MFGVYNPSSFKSCPSYINTLHFCRITRCFDEKGMIITNTSQTFAKVQTEVALKPLMCRIQEAFSRVFYQLLFLCAGKFSVTLCFVPLTGNRYSYIIRYSQFISWPFFQFLLHANYLLYLTINLIYQA